MMIEGEIYSWTLMREEVTPKRFLWCAPYIMLLVQIDNGPMVTAMMTDVVSERRESEDEDEEENRFTSDLVCPEIGQRVELVTRKLFELGEERGMIVYGYKAREIIESASQEEIQEIRDQIRVVIDKFYR